MKRILFAVAVAFGVSPALAADLPPPGPAPVAPAYYKAPEPFYNWSGFYLGINGGGAFGSSNWTDPVDVAPGNFNVNGFLIGGTVGANYQVGSFVFGAEADWDWQNLDATTFNNSCAGVGCETKSDWLATVRGRAGWAWDRLLIYGTGGAAFANVQAGAGVLPFSSSTQVGWTAGGGVEYAFLPNLTAKVEYLFVDLQNQSCAPGNCGGGTGFVPATPVNTNVSLNENVVRAGLNYKFGYGGW